MTRTQSVPRWARRRRPASCRSLRRCGSAGEEIFTSCKIDPWFLAEMRGFVVLVSKIKSSGLPGNAFGMRSLKAMGFSDARLAVLADKSEADVTAQRHALGVRPVFKRIDT